MSGEPQIVEAVFAFKGSNNDELCFKKGDLVTVTQKDEGWWEGTLNGKTGWFPSNYVKESNDAPKPIILQENQYKSVVLKDLIDSEKAHVTELEGLVTNFLQPLEKSSILSQDEYKQLTGNILEVLDTHQQLLKLVESEEVKPGPDQRVGTLFLTWAARIKNVHQAYCSLHPRAVCILDKYREELTKYMESRGAASPGVLVLTTLLSKPFRRLDKYSAMLQELERHVEECHPDRGDTQRSVAVYKEIATVCSATRRQKELELQVLTGPVRGWEGPSLTVLGDIIYMGSVAVGAQHHDRYFVLFPTTLLILSVSHRLSAFIYEGKLPLSGLVVNRLEDNDQYKNAFEISAPMVDRKVAVCQSRNEANHWVELLRKHMPRSSTASNLNQKVSPSQAQFVPQPPPHLNPRGYSNRTSVLTYKERIDYCTTTLPPSTYPPAAPFAALTKLFSGLIKAKVINSKLLKKLLYPEYLNKFNLSLVRIRHHKSECVIIPKVVNCRMSVIECETSSDDSDSSRSSDGGFNQPITRQNALKKSSDDDSSDSSGNNPFGYIRYYNPKTALETKYESVIDYSDTSKINVGIVSHPKVVVVEDEESPKKSSVVVTSTAQLFLLQKQGSETSEGSSILLPKPRLACENLLNLDDNLEMDNLRIPREYVPLERQSCPTKLVGNKFSESSRTMIYIPSWSNSDDNITCKTNFASHSSSLELPTNATIPLPDQVTAEILYNFDNADNKSVIKPPSMFQSGDGFDNLTDPLSLSRENVKFRTHSINSDKPLRSRRSSIQMDRQDLQNAKLKRCVSSKFVQLSNAPTNRRSFCRCCSECSHSPRSSDSGMAGSCTLNSPDLAGPSDAQSTGLIGRVSVDMTNFFGSKDNLEGLRLSEIEARDFESQCPCTSPFGSTPRTSISQPSMSGNNSLRTSVTSSLDSCPQPWPGLYNGGNAGGGTVTSMSGGPHKSRSTGCLVVDDPVDELEEIACLDDDSERDKPIYKSGLYAHWWLKAKIPASVVKGIYQDTRPTTTTDVSAGGSRDASDAPRAPK